MSTCTFRKMGNPGAREMAQWGMCLMQKPEDLVQISSTDKKSSVVAGYPSCKNWGNGDGSTPGVWGAAN